MIAKPNLTIRSANRADAPALHNLHTASVTTLCTTHYARPLLLQWIAKRTPEGYFPGIDRGEMFVGEIETDNGREIAGWGHAVPGEVVGLFVHPRYAGRGVGSALLAHALELARSGHARPVKLVATLNAQAFYEKHGFVETARYAVKRNSVDVPVVEMELSTQSNH
jgi:GNAT superfamily N-acetyltransferase